MRILKKNQVSAKKNLKEIISLTKYIAIEYFKKFWKNNQSSSKNNIKQKEK